MFYAKLTIRFGDLAFGRGNAKARTGDKLSNSHKIFREHTPRLTPNRLLAAGIFFRFIFCLQDTIFRQIFNLIFCRFSKFSGRTKFSSCKIHFSVSAKISLFYCLKDFRKIFKARNRKFPL